MSRLVHRCVRMPVSRFPGMQRLQRSTMIDLERRPGPRNKNSLNTIHVYLYTCRVIDYIANRAHIDVSRTCLCRNTSRTYTHVRELNGMHTHPVTEVCAAETKHAVPASANRPCMEEKANARSVLYIVVHLYLRMH